jgi:hypothetical protein
MGLGGAVSVTDETGRAVSAGASGVSDGGSEGDVDGGSDFPATSHPATISQTTGYWWIL